MRIALDVSAVPNRPVGAGVYTIALARGLAARGDLELHLITRRDDARWAALTPGAELHAEVPARRPARLAWEQLGAPRLARRLGADVWHGPHYTLPLRMNTASVVTVHDLTFFDHPEWHERTKVAYFRRMILAAGARADVVVCVSEFTEARLRAHCTPRGTVVVIPHGVDHARFAPAPAAARGDTALLARHGITPPYIAFCGTLEPRKDLTTLVHAFARIAREHPDLRLILAGGDGWGAGEVRAAIASSGAATRVLRPGYLEDEAVVALFRRAAAVVYPSLEEGFGLNALEALACGTPLVTTRGSAIEEVVDGAALMVAPHDVAGLGAALGRALCDHVLAAKLRRAGIERAASFTWERSVDAHVDAYRRALQQRGPAA